MSGQRLPYLVIGALREGLFSVRQRGTVCGVAIPLLQAKRGVFVLTGHSIK